MTSFESSSRVHFVYIISKQNVSTLVDNLKEVETIVGKIKSIREINLALFYFI